jgi:TPR repeat protein
MRRGSVTRCWVRDAGKYQEAVPLLRRSVALGCPHACVILGNCYFNGQGVAKDNDQALKYYRQVGLRQELTRPLMKALQRYE